VVMVSKSINVKVGCGLRVTKLKDDFHVVLQLSCFVEHSVSSYNVITYYKTIVSYFSIYAMKTIKLTNHFLKMKETK